MTGLRIRRGAAALGLLCSTALGGCGFLGSDGSAASAEQEPVQLTCPAAAADSGPLTLVVGARANSPQPVLPAQVKTLVHDAALAGQHIRIIRLDGDPGVLIDQPFDSQEAANQNKERLAKNLDAFTSEIEQYVDTLTPKAPQADYLTALSVAGRYTPAGGTIVVLDSGISTTGTVSFTDQSMFGFSADKVADFLDQQHLLPDLKGKAVVFGYLGQATAPQPKLEQNIQQNVTDLWTTIVTRAGASCHTYLDAPPAAASVTTNMAVAVVHPPVPAKPNTCGQTITQTVYFASGLPDFRDKESAETSLKSIAGLMVGGTQIARVVGSVSSDGDPGVDTVLSLSRAETVKQGLVARGVDQSRVTTAGAGTAAAGRKTDKTKDGTVIPWAAADNQSATITLVCPTS